MHVDVNSEPMKQEYDMHPYMLKCALKIAIPVGPIIFSVGGNN